MKFFISEGNLGSEATKAQAEMVIAALQKKGWDVAYGAAENKATDISEFGQEETILNNFTDDFMACLDAMGL
ncbi:MAG: hypothetical protein ABIL58_02855 [Pseudomonadota bacterium]